MEVIQKEIDSAPYALGLAVIISNDYKSNPQYGNLNGTEKDGDALESSFKTLRYTVVRKHNTSLSFLVALLKKVSSGLRYPPSYKAIAFVFAGHGEAGGNLITSEGNKISIEGIVRILSPSSNDASTTQLGDMARMFFIDACRGEKDDLGFHVTPRGASANPRGGKPVELLRIPSEPTNIVVAYSTVAGYRSYEIDGQGGIWLQSLAKKLIKCDCSIGDVLTEVNGDLKDLFQKNPKMKIMNPECINRLTKSVYLLRDSQQISSAVKVSNQAQSLSLPLSSCSASSPVIKCTKPKVHLAANFFSNDTTYSLPTVSGGASIPACQPVRHPVVAFDRNPEVVLCRDGKVPKQGFYRARLNDYKMKQIVEEWDISSKDNGQSYRSMIKCRIRGGRIVIGDSIRYYAGKRSISEEKAVEDALNKIDKILSDTQPAVLTLEPTRVNEAVTSNQLPKVYKGKLNNFLHQQEKLDMPQYKTVEVDDKQFQCTIHHSVFGSITGSKCLSKKDAENSAAWRAWTHLIQTGRMTAT